MEGIVRHPYTTVRERVQLSFADSIARTKQSFKAECDINTILEKYQRTGILEHARRHGGDYGFAPAVDFKQAMDIVAQGRTMFEELPSSLRRRFGDPESYLAFVQDPDNREEMRELGMLRADLPPAEPEGPEGPTEEPPKADAGDPAEA